ADESRSRIQHFDTSTECSRLPRGFPGDSLHLPRPLEGLLKKSEKLSHGVIAKGLARIRPSAPARSKMICSGKTERERPHRTGIVQIVDRTRDVPRVGQLRMLARQVVAEHGQVEAAETCADAQGEVTR